MLSRKYRANRQDIEETIKTGVIVSGVFIYAKVSRKDKKKNTFAIIIPKKTEKTSVGRHLIKRKINACIEDYLNKAGIDFKKTIILFIKKEEKTTNYKTIRKDVDFIFNKINKTLHK